MCVCVCVSVFVCVCVPVCMCACMRACVLALSTCTCVHVYVYTCTRAYDLCVCGGKVQNHKSVNPARNMSLLQHCNGLSEDAHIKPLMKLLTSVISENNFIVVNKVVYLYGTINNSRR